MKVLVCGGRNYRDAERVNETLDRLHRDTPISHVITGGATGADSLGEWWAFKTGVQSVVCRANWDRYGNSAGARRNVNMLALGPDLVVAFPGGNGTAHMVRIAKVASVLILEVTP